MSMATRLLDKKTKVTPAPALKMTKDEFRTILRQANIIAFAKRMRYDGDEVERETLRGINEWLRENRDEPKP